MVFKIINIGSNPVFLVCSFLKQVKIKFLFYFTFRRAWDSTDLFNESNYRLKKEIETYRTWYKMFKHTIFVYKEFFVQNYNWLDTMIVFFFFRFLQKLYYRISAVSCKLKQLTLKTYKYLKVKVFQNNTFLAGLKYCWLFIRFWVVGLLLFITVTYYFMLIRVLPFNRIIFQWVIVIMIVYWLMSGFTFFIRKYRYGKFTSAVQRFWRRSFMLFWLIETFLFLIFFYLTINSNQEPVYMYDNFQLYKTHLFSWRWFLLKILPITILVIFSYLILLFLKWGTFSKENLPFFSMTLLLMYVIWLEFYQFFHVLNYYGNLVWIYNSEEHLWILESEFRKTRIVNHYVTICIVAKFWHLVFIFVFWVFFVLRCNELKRYRYPIFSANLQNFIMLYFLTWISMYPWFKFVFRRYLDNPYFWFYSNPRRTFLKLFYNDLKLIYYAFGIMKDNFIYFIYFTLSNYFYFVETSNITEFNEYGKFMIRNRFIKNNTPVIQ